MTPVLYSFRRCPYAMRARLALWASGSRVELREILLRDKPTSFLDVSPSATVPCLHSSAGVLDESLDIMRWALAQSDPHGWLDMPSSGNDWIEQADGPFKHALDRTKYAARYPDDDPHEHREDAHAFLAALEAELDDWIYDRPTLADYAILPFIRQFAFIDKPRFDAQDWPKLHRWLDRFLTSSAFEGIMQKYPTWQPDQPPVYFPAS